MQSMTFQELTEQIVALYHQKKFEEAHRLLEAHRDSFPEQAARLTFWRMCFLSLAGHPAEVLAVFQQGLDSGLWWSQELFADSDLDAVRDLPEFQRLASLAEQKYQEAQKSIPPEHAVLVPDPPPAGRYPLLIALHGRNANKETHLGFWEVARQRGWLVVSPQSTQPLFPGAYCWDNPAQGIADVLFSYEQVSQKYAIDPERLVTAGFSQGSGMAIYTALSGTISARGFIGIASWWEDPKSLVSQTEGAAGIRGYFITGAQDHTLETAKEMQNVLRAHGIAFEEEIHAGLAHEFPPEFEQSFEKAIHFIFSEQE